ncbi:hypothetical protein RJT34_06909 [Clitoria ternatea]|uniref:Remorin C-terminal domain-containing protein n=1 Tax=Clitoria ternatea TaxID=43366 RepID=A0AAN9PUK1_CLITE
MENLLNQMRMQFTGGEESKADGTRDPKISIQKTQSFKAEKKQGNQNWFQKQFARKSSRDHDSRDLEHAAAVAAAAFAINVKEISELKSEIGEASLPRTKSKADGTKSSIPFLGSASKRFSDSFRSKDDQVKREKSSVTDESKPEKVIMPAPSMKKSSTFTDGIVPPPSIRQTSRQPEPERQSIPPTERHIKADEWERTELQKIRSRYDKLREMIDSWETKKKMKARRKLNKEEGELVQRRLKALENFQNKTMYIDQIAGGARTKAEESRKNEELKAKEKANVIRTTGKMPRIFFCI